MKKKILSVGLTTILALGLVACDKNALDDLSKVTLEDIQEANKGDQLLKNYDSIQYQMEIHSDGGKYTEKAGVAKVDGEYCYTVRLEDSEAFRTETCKDGFIFAEYGDLDGAEYSTIWCMDGEYDAYLKECVEGFLVADVDDLDITEVLEEDDYVSVTAQVDEGDNVSEEYDYFYEYVMDKSDLSVSQFVAYSVDQEKEKSIMSFAEVSYGEKFEVPSCVAKLQKEEQRTVKVVVDPGKSTEKTYEVKIAGTSAFDALLTDGYMLYTDKKGESMYEVGSEVPGENGMYSDMTVYAIND